jgi:hypothetical protein
MNMRSVLWMLQLLPVTLAGCAVDGESAQDEATGAMDQAVTIAGGYAWGSTTGTTVDLGSATGYTCFLTSVVGQMVSGFTDMGVPPFPARAGVALENGHWIFREWSSNAAMGASVQCVASDLNRTAVRTWHRGDAAVLLGPATPHRKCFLTEVAKTDYSQGWSHDSDFVRVWNDGTNWYVGGTQSGSASGSAVCVDFPGDYGSWLWVAGTGTTTHPLAYNPGGVACFLTGLGGSFNNPDWNDGVTIGYDPGILTYNETVSNGKSGWATCVQ